MLKSSENIKYYFDYEVQKNLNIDFKKSKPEKILKKLIESNIKKVEVVDLLADKTLKINILPKKYRYTHKDFIFDEREKALTVFLFFLNHYFQRYKTNPSKFFILMDKNFELLPKNKYDEIEKQINEMLLKQLEKYPEIVIKYQKYLKR